MPGPAIRRTGFWIVDALRGGTIREHFKDLSENTGRPCSEEQLLRLLAHAAGTTPFYQRLNQTRLANGCTLLSELADFPVVSKADFKQDCSAFQSQLFLGQKLHQMLTSGSTGIPFRFFQDFEKRRRVLAEIVYFNQVAGHRLGDRLLYLRVWNERTRKSKLEQIKQNMVPFDVTKMEQAMPLVVNTLKQDRRITSVLAYGSVLTALAKHLSEDGADPSMFNLKNVFSSSEKLDLQSKQVLSDIMGCRVFDRYSNQENGILAQTQHNSDEFAANTSSYYIELLDMKEDNPARKGELGRIVVTDLYNFAMPMIRYDTGDTAVKLENGSGQQSRFGGLQGRLGDILYNCEGKMVPIAALSFSVWKFVRHKQFQLIQEGPFQYRVRVNGSENAYPDSDIIAEFRKFLGDDAVISLEFVDEALVYASGKFQASIRDYEYDERNYPQKDV